MELIEKITEVTKIAAQEMKDIRLQANKRKLNDAVDNIGVAFPTMEVLTEIIDTKAANKSVKDIVSEMLDSDDDSDWVEDEETL